MLKAFSCFFKVAGDYLEFLSTHRKMVVGRFHAAVSCSVLGIPFSSWDSNTWKTKGLMLDMGISHLHFDSRNEAIANMPEEFPEEIIGFRRSAKERIEAMFDQLETIAKH